MVGNDTSQVFVESLGFEQVIIQMRKSLSGPVPGPEDPADAAALAPREVG